MVNVYIVHQSEKKNSSVICRALFHFKEEEEEEKHVFLTCDQVHFFCSASLQAMQIPVTHMQTGEKKTKNIYFDTDAERASTVFHKWILSFCRPFKPFQWFPVPSQGIIRLPLSPETQELDHKRQFHRSIRKFHTGIYKEIQMGRRETWGGMWGVGVKRYVTFYSQDTGDKSRHQWICPAAAKYHQEKWTTGRFHLLALMSAGDEGSRTDAMPREG